MLASNSSVFTRQFTKVKPLVEERETLIRNVTTTFDLIHKLYDEGQVAHLITKLRDERLTTPVEAMLLRSTVNALVVSAQLAADSVQTLDRATSAILDTAR